MAFVAGRGGRALVLAALPLLLAPAACSGDGEKKPPASGNTASSAPAQGTGKAIGVRTSFWNPKARIELLSLQRMAGKAVTAKFRVVNGADSSYPIESSLTGRVEINQKRPNAVDPAGVSKLSLIDGRNARLHFPLNLADGTCLCTRSQSFSSSVGAGQSLEMTAAFPAPPQDVKTMHVLFPHAPPFQDVPMTDVPAGPVAFDPRAQPVDPTKAGTAEPLILPITGSVETGPNAEDEDGANLRVRLSTDVLFAVDKADLSGAAQQVLAQVAQKIDRSTGSTVQVDGYTDSTGNDAINDPLSRRRAEAVKAALAKLVTRKGVAFQARGHGSADPVASNKTDGGRKKNRRVTVLFTRPSEPAAGASASAAPSPAPASDLMQSGPRPVLARAPISPQRPAGTVNAWPAGGQVEINSLRRDSTGYATLVWTVNNTDRSTALDPSFMADPDGGYYGSSPSGVVLAAGDRRMRVLRDSDWYAVGAPDFNAFGPSNRFKMGPGQSEPLWAMFKVPADVKTVTVEIPGYQPARNVPVG